MVRGSAARDQPYTPQPYAQASNVLREMGQPEMANDVIYAGRERERNEAWQRGDNLRCSGLSLLNWTIGYGVGHRYFRRCTGRGLVLIATIVLGVTGQNMLPRWGEKRIGIWYSFDSAADHRAAGSPLRHRSERLHRYWSISTSSSVTCWRRS